MITLHTLNNHSLQEIFSHVKHHLLTQNKKAYVLTTGGRESCKYHSPDGLRCAVGCLISEEEYEPEFEGKSIEIILSNVGITLQQPKTLSLLNKLQGIHDDTCNVEYWSNELRKLADSYKLTY